MLTLPTRKAILSGKFAPSGKTLLHAAAEEGNVVVGNVLLMYGANPNAIYQGEVFNVRQKTILTGALTPLHLAVFNGHIAFVQVLLNNPLTNPKVRLADGRMLLNLLPSPYTYLDNHLAQATLGLLYMVAAQNVSGSIWLRKSCFTN